ncbi:dihydrofolate reductase [Tessaracoccus sp. OH4464_COT-324]|uniref:dihydrofolate reductase n=1 Tax=Tessaracoccus sp. OH4464_COT-324 TaxID=2491059 RepID=UPI000F640EA8|nr:dihydrofolate reductase [Tessaracoccus sp. OH4464_COT-324]RRD46827.1 dihydrofolate reductase [Tessaracoccus sp. OH4464_COT-324]
MRIVAIAAVAENWVIGSGEDMLWHLPDDFKRFKAVTTGNTLIFGRRTHEQIGRTLPGRRIIVVTRDRSWRDDTVEVAHSIEEALELAAQTPEKVCYIGGGAEIYAAAWPYLTELDITHVHQAPEGAATFPYISPREWTEVSREPHEKFDFVAYLPTPK